MDNFDQPKNCRVLIAAAKALLPVLLYFRHGHRKLQIAAGGMERIRQLQGQRTIICPNHASWDDADMMFSFSRLIGEDFTYLTAWEVLHRSRINHLWLQHLGCYPVTRGQADRKAYEVTRSLLLSGKQKVVIFPEGEISHEYDTLWPIKAGMIQIAFSALQKMEKERIWAPIYVLPLVIRYKFLNDVRPALTRSVAALEQALQTECRLEAPLFVRINAVAQAVVEKLSRKFAVKADEADPSLDCKIAALRAAMLEHCASILDKQLDNKMSHLEQAHALQSALYARLYDKSKTESDKTLSKQELLTLPKLLHLVVDLLAMHENFVGPDSSDERLAQVLDLMEVEVFDGHPKRKGEMEVTFVVGAPINLLIFLPQYRKNKTETENTVIRLYQDEMDALLHTSWQNRSPTRVIAETKNTEIGRCPGG